jgi:ribosomal protein S2
LIVKNNDFYNLNYYFNNKNVFFYSKKWIGGLLTNFRLVRKNKIFASKELLAVNNINFLRYMPSLIFIFDTKISKWPLFEAYNLEIPTSSIINSSSLYIDFINYPVIGNNKSFEAIYLYVNFIRNAIMKGKQKERLKILRIL